MTRFPSRLRSLYNLWHMRLRCWEGGGRSWPRGEAKIHSLCQKQQSFLIFFVMASRGRGRRTSLGLLSGRLRGGFTVSSIPRATSRIPESRSGNPPSIADVVQDRSQAEGSVGPVDITATNSNDVCVCIWLQCLLLYGLCRRL